MHGASSAASVGAAPAPPSAGAMVVLRRNAGSRRPPLAAMDVSSEFLSLQPGGRRTSRERAAPAVSSRGVPSERALGAAGAEGVPFRPLPPQPRRPQAPVRRPRGQVHAGDAAGARRAALRISVN